MAKILPNDFTAYAFTPEEESVAVVFTELQVQHLITEKAAAANEFLSVIVDPSNVHKAELERMYIMGKIDAIKYLLQLHDTQKDTVEQKLRDAISSQSQG